MSCVNVKENNLSMSFLPSTSDKNGEETRPSHATTKQREPEPGVQNHLSSWRKNVLNCGLRYYAICRLFYSKRRENTPFKPAGAGNQA